jgi:FliI/YscN family ATPase
VTLLGAEIRQVRACQPLEVMGTVAALRGLTLLVDDLALPIGALVRVGCAAIAQSRLGEVVGFDAGRAVIMLLGPTAGVRPGDRVRSVEITPSVRVSRRMLGRIVDAFGRPIDGKGAIEAGERVPIMPDALAPMRRARITKPLATGVRAIDGMLTTGAGQRLGVFAGPGVGKSTLLGSIARFTEADISVIALIGERGREVRDFIESALGPEGLARSIVVVATSDESPLLRIRALLAACAIAERFRAENANVMLMVDSVTRFAQAQRQVGLAVGEPPATKGYTPSVFALLPMVLERAGAVEGAGTITGFYTVLVEGDDLTEPVSDAVRGILDGHVVLSRDLARRGHFPAIDVLDSVSRVADGISTEQHIAARRRVLTLLAAHKEVEDLVQIGAYARGSDPDADIAIEMKQKIDAYLRQKPNEADTFDHACDGLMALAIEAGTRAQAMRAGQGRPQGGQQQRRAGQGG